MTEVLEQIQLKRGTIANRAVARFAVNYPILTSDETRATGASLVVITDSDRDVAVSTGETFAVRDQVWRLDSAELVGDDDYRIVISRVG